jgi:lipid-A-disaccharide synthase
MADAGASIVLVAGETSGDNLGAALIEALKARRPGLKFEGVAGPRMVAAGCSAWASSEGLAVMGLFEVLKHLPAILRLRKSLEARTCAAHPAAWVGIDFAEFNLSLAARLKRHGVTTVQYVSPQVWAWRQGRVRGMARALDLVLCLLPFEKRFYDGAGLAAEFVGHPLADRLPVRPDRAAARSALALPQDAPVVAILPGSRRGEVERLAPDFLGAAAWLKARRPDVRFVAPMANRAARAIFEAAQARTDAPPVAVTDGGADRALTAANVALVASGTATLETLLCKRPMVVAYRFSAATAALFRALGLMKAPFFAQPNLLAGREVVPELFQAAVTPERLGRELLAFLDDPPRVAALEAEFTKIHETLRLGASERAAEAILALIDRAAGVAA